MTYELKNCLSPFDFKGALLDEILVLAAAGKKSRWSGHVQALKGKTAGLVFFNPSLRTRASFQSGISKLGGSAAVININSDSWSIETREGVVMNGDTAEHIKEAAPVLSSYFDVIGVRCFPKMESWSEDQKDELISAFAGHSSAPVINMESALWHPCQALADALTIREKLGPNVAGKKIVLSWTDHPKQLPVAVPNSVMVTAAMLGMDVTLACPPGYELSEEILGKAADCCAEKGGLFSIEHEQSSAFKEAHVVYAKSWTPPKYIGTPALELKEREELKSWIVTEELMSRTADAFFMHCLPIRRGVVAEDAVLDSKTSAVLAQAENRLHAQNALLLKILGKES